MDDHTQAALNAAQYDLPVFPVRPGFKDPPLIAGWQKSATTDLAVGRCVWRGYPQANIGIFTGRGLIVVDVDSKTGAAALRDHSLPTTPTSRTKRGHHMFYRGSIRAPKEPLPDVNIKSQGGYVVGAGSSL